MEMAQRRTRFSVGASTLREFFFFFFFFNLLEKYLKNAKN